MRFILFITLLLLIELSAVTNANVIPQRNTPGDLQNIYDALLSLNNVDSSDEPTAEETENVSLTEELDNLLGEDEFDSENLDSEKPIQQQEDASFKDDPAQNEIRERRISNNIMDNIYYTTLDKQATQQLKKILLGMEINSRRLCEGQLIKTYGIRDLEDIKLYEKACKEMF